MFRPVPISWGYQVECQANWATYGAAPRVLAYLLPTTIPCNPIFLNTMLLLMVMAVVMLRTPLFYVYAYQSKILNTILFAFRTLAPIFPCAALTGHMPALAWASFSGRWTMALANTHNL